MPHGARSPCPQPVPMSSSALSSAWPKAGRFPFASYVASLCSPPTQVPSTGTAQQVAHEKDWLGTRKGWGEVRHAGGTEAKKWPADPRRHLAQLKHSPPCSLLPSSPTYFPCPSPLSAAPPTDLCKQGALPRRSPWVTFQGMGGLCHWGTKS
jgi:hypothetical protein